MPENLSLKMINEGLVALSAHQCGPCRVTQCRVLQKTLQLIHLQPPVRLSTYTHSLLYTHMCSSSEAFCPMQVKQVFLRGNAAELGCPNPMKSISAVSPERVKSTLNFCGLWWQNALPNSTSRAGGFHTTCNPNFRSLITNPP